MNRIMIGGSAVPCFTSRCLWHDSDISESSKFYIFCNELFDVQVYIIKGSPEAKELETWLSNENNRNNESVQEKSFEYIIPKLTVNDILEMVKVQKEHSHYEGYKDAQFDIRRALGL